MQAKPPTFVETKRKMKQAEQVSTRRGGRSRQYNTTDARGLPAFWFMVKMNQATGAAWDAYLSQLEYEQRRRFTNEEAMAHLLTEKLQP